MRARGLLPPQAIALLLTLAASVLSAWAGAPKNPDMISFRYAPPDGTFIETITMRREKIFEGMSSQVDRRESKANITIRHSDDGYLVTAKPLSMEMTRDGKAVRDPLSELLKDVVVTYRIGRDGHIEEIDGYGDLLEKVRESFPKPVAESLAPILNEQALTSREIAEWNGRIGDFAGSEFQVGESISAEVPFTLPNGVSIVYFMETSFPGWEPCPAGSCARVVVQYDSDATALQQKLMGTLAKLTAGAESKPAPPSVSGARIEGSGSRLIDPSTMLIYEESVSRTMRVTMEVPGRGPVPVTVKEERTYSFSY